MIGGTYQEWHIGDKSIEQALRLCGIDKSCGQNISKSRGKLIIYYPPAKGGALKAQNAEIDKITKRFG